MSLDAVNVIRIHVDEQEVHEVPVKRFHELTIEEFLSMADLPEDLPVHERLSKIFKLPTRITMAMTTPERIALLSWYNQWIGEGNDIVKRTKRVHEALKEFEEGEKKAWNMEQLRDELAKDSIHRTEIEVDGVKYNVPQDIGSTTKFGQWMQLRGIQEGHKGHEAGMYPAILATFCFEDGDRWLQARKDEDPDAFGERFDQWFADRVALFHRAKYIDAQAVTAFFFSNNTEFAQTMRHSLNSSRK